jgi:hypothetical protein
LNRPSDASPTATPAAPRVVETHTAILFFVGDRVHKLKKPVRFPFLDFSTCETREDTTARIADLMGRRADAWPSAAPIDTGATPLASLRMLRDLVESDREENAAAAPSEARSTSSA